MDTLKDLNYCKNFAERILIEHQALRVVFTREPNVWLSSCQDLERFRKEDITGKKPLFLVEIHTLSEVLKDLEEEMIVDIAEWIENEEGIDKEIILADNDLRKLLTELTNKFLDEIKNTSIVLVYIRIDVVLNNGFQMGYEIKDTQQLEKIKRDYYERIDKQFGDYIPIHVLSFLETPDDVLVFQIKEMAEHLQLSLEDAFYEEAKKYHVSRAAEKILANPNNRPSKIFRVPSKLFQVFLRLKDSEGYIS